jgi:hypothetical protein
MMLEQDGAVLRIYLGESDKHDGKPLYEWIIHQAKDHGIEGCTVWRGITGFGAHHQIHTAKILDLSTSLPIVVEMVDTFEKIEAFLPILDSGMKQGSATVETAHVRFYRPSP